MEEIELFLKLLGAEAMQAPLYSPEDFSGWLLSCARIASRSQSFDEFFRRLRSLERMDQLEDPLEKERRGLG